MPIHDWTRVDAGTFHAFHVAWITHLTEALNDGLLPAGFFALPEQVIAGPIPDVVTLERQPGGAQRRSDGGGLAMADMPPRAAFVMSVETDPYAQRANRIVVRHPLGDVVAVVEIVPPHNKSSQQKLRTFVEKAHDLVQQGIHLLIVDLFPPSPRDPHGIHKAIWSTICDGPFELPRAKFLTVVSYYAASPRTAYVDPLAVGDPLPSSPLFLDAGLYVPAPLEQTYTTTWERCPTIVKELVEGK
jgi:hypothetical protein